MAPLFPWMFMRAHSASGTLVISRVACVRACGQVPLRSYPAWGHESVLVALTKRRPWKSRQGRVAAEFSLQRGPRSDADFHQTNTLRKESSSRQIIGKRSFLLVKFSSMAYLETVFSKRTITFIEVEGQSKISCKRARRERKLKEVAEKQIIRNWRDGKDKGKM